MMGLCALHAAPAGRPLLLGGPSALQGATAKKLNLPSEQRFWSNGISACAICDGASTIFKQQASGGRPGWLLPHKWPLHGRRGLGSGGVCWRQCCVCAACMPAAQRRGLLTLDEMCCCCSWLGPYGLELSCSTRLE